MYRDAILVSVTISLKKEVYDKLREYCIKYNVSESLVIARLIEQFLQFIAKREEVVKNE